MQQLRRPMKLAMLGGGAQYWQKVKVLFGANLIEYHPFWEASGTTIADLSPTGRTRTLGYPGVTLAAPGIGDGHTAAAFSGADFEALVHFYPMAAFNGSEGGFFTWVKVFNAAQWTDGDSHYINYFQADGNNYFFIMQDGFGINYGYMAGGAASNHTYGETKTAKWVNIGITWSLSNNRVTCYFGGDPVAVEANAGTWAGALAEWNTWLGAALNGDLNWYGWQAHTVIVNREVTHAEASALALPNSGGLPALINVMPYGDSKTTLFGSYQWRMSSGNHSFWETPVRLGAAGRTTEDAQAAIDAELAVAVGTPNYVLYNLGANDVLGVRGGTILEADWKADTLYILDAMRAKWPSVQVYMMRVWGRGADAECNTIDGWVADCVAARSTFARLGPDERIFLENGDNGVTYTSDGTHPNEVGYDLTGVQWRAVLGF